MSENGNANQSYLTNRQTTREATRNGSMTANTASSNLIPASSQINNRRQSIASRLFQFATGVSGNSTLSPGDPLPVSPSYQSVQTSQQESYSRLREHLFPSSSHPNVSSSTTTGISTPVSVASTLGPGLMIPNHRSTRSTASSRFQQMVQSAVLNNPQNGSDRQSNRDLFHPQSLSPLSHGLRPNHGNRNQPVATMHPSFRSKVVCQLGCSFCTMEICKRGMRAILLADTSVELYSTDDVSKGRVQLVGDDYLTENCQCRIRDVACLGCGNVVGYHVTQPCELCLNSCNNGHFWMFLSDFVQAKERLDSSGQKALVWAHLLEQREVCENVSR